jgi:hypothetical protein
MINRLIISAVVVLLATTSYFAHHSTAMFDMRNPITLNGSVTAYHWVNPHCFIKLDVTTSDGKVEQWDVETHSISLLSRKGWTKTSFKAGDKITVTGGQMKNGTKMIRLLRGTKADGWKFYGDDFSGYKPGGEQ